MQESKSHYEPGLVSAVIVNYNGARHLDDCINSLKAQSHAPIEILVVDNGSTDNSHEVCARHGVQFLFSGGNHGLGYAYNFGARAGRGEFLFLSNNDIWLDPHCIERLVSALVRRGDRCFAADPLQYDWERTTIIHHCGALRPLTGLRELVSGTFSVFPLLAQTYKRSQEEQVIPIANGGAMLARHNLFDELGGFDEAFFMDWEDVDLAWRANRRGWENVFVPSAWIRHKWGATSSQVSRTESKAVTPLGYRLMVSQQYNIMRFALKNYDFLNAVGYITLRCAANAVHLARGKSAYAKAGVAAVGKVIKSLGDILRQRKALRRVATVSNRDLFRRFRVGEHEPFAKTWPAQ